MNGVRSHHLGISGDLPLTSRLYADLGLDSITLVVILLDIADQLELDLRAPIKMSSVGVCGR